MNIKITAPQLSELKYFRPIIKKTFEILDNDYNQNTAIPCRFLPSSGKEISLTPVFYHAAIDAYKDSKRKYTPCADNKKGQ